MSDREPDIREEDLEPTKRRIEEALRVDPPDARREKAMFVAGVSAAHGSRRWFGPFVPALAAVILLVAIGVASRTAQPGQALFPVRKVLGNVGLAPSTAAEIRAELNRAEDLVVAAAADAATRPARAQELVRQAWAALETADDLVGELDSDRRGPYERAIDALEERAEAAYERAEETLEAREEAAEEAAEDDSSGRGSGGGDDSSGSGSGDDDSSGSGSGGDDDSSGSGSGSDDDSSGSGSGSGDDSSGSGSGGGDSSGSGSGGDDSSGSGSGDND